MLQQTGCILNAPSTVNRMTHAYENITFPDLLRYTVDKNENNVIRLFFNLFRFAWCK